LHTVSGISGEPNYNTAGLSYAASVVNFLDCGHFTIPFVFIKCRESIFAFTAKASLP
jgi:hypothetical protein